MFLSNFCLIALAVFALPASIVAQARYTVHDLSTLGKPGTFAKALNKKGEVVGTGTTAAGQSHAFRTAANHPINSATDDLGTLGGATSFADDINDLEQVVGSSQISASDLFPRAFRTGPNLPINPATDNLGTFPGPPQSVAHGINNRGQVVGSGSLGILNNHAFRTAPNATLNPNTDDLGSLSPNTFPQDTEANKINTAGVVVGVSTVSNNTQHAFRTAPNQGINPLTDDLGTLGGPYSSATDVNDAGRVVGLSATALNDTHAFLTAASAATSPLIDLGTLGGLSSGANALNNSAQVVGYSSTPDGHQHAFVYSGGTMLDLNTLTTSTPPLVLSQATDINDFGQIVANAIDTTGAQHAFRLDPTAAGYIYLLVDTVESFDLPAGVTARFTASLHACLAGLQNRAVRHCVQDLLVFDRQILLARGVQVSDSQVNMLLKIQAHAISMFLSDD